MTTSVLFFLLSKYEALKKACIVFDPLLYWCNKHQRPVYLLAIFTIRITHNILNMSDLKHLVSLIFEVGDTRAGTLYS